MKMEIETIEVATITISKVYCFAADISYLCEAPVKQEYQNVFIFLLRVCIWFTHALWFLHCKHKMQDNFSRR